MKGINVNIIFGIILLMLTATGQQLIDARGTAMAFSNSAATRGLESAGLNPATLALPHWAHFELNLLSMNVSVANNSFNQGLYNRYFTTGDSLSGEDKTALLNAIPAAGLEGRFAARVNTLAFYLPNFSLSLTGIGNGSVNLPKEIAELALMGNDDLGRVYDFSQADAVGWGGLAVQVGFAKRFDFQEDGLFDLMTVGVTGKYLSGLGYFEVMRSQAQFYNADETNLAFRLDGEFEARSARGGSGVAMDIGMVMHKNNKLSVSLAILNTFGSIRWNAQTEAMLYSIHADSLTLSSNGVEDSLIVTRDSSYAIGEFSTRLPLVFDVGVAYYPLKPLLLTAAIEKSFSDNLGGSKAFRLAMGMELNILPFLPLRSGISLGGINGTSVAFGMGLNLHFWYLDVAMVNHGGLSSGSSRGMTLAMTTRFRF